MDPCIALLIPRPTSMLLGIHVWCEPSWEFLTTTLVVTAKLAATIDADSEARPTVVPGCVGAVVVVGVEHAGRTADANEDTIGFDCLCS